MDIASALPPARAFSAEHLQQLVNELGHGVVMVNNGLTIQLWNDWLARQTGITSAFARGKHLLEVLPGLKHSSFIEKLQGSLQENEQGFEWVRVGAAHSLLHQFQQGCHLADISRMVCRCVKQGAGVSGWIEIHQEPAAVAESGAIGKYGATTKHKPTDNLFPVLLGSEAMGLITIDSFGFIAQINQAMLDLVGFDEADLLDKPLRLIFPEIADAASGEQFRFMIKAVQRRNGDGFLDAVSADGGAIRCDVWVFDSAAHKDHLVLCCHDVTRITGMQVALHQHKEQLNAIFNQVADGILILDQRGYIQAFNPVGGEMLGLNYRRQGYHYIDDTLALHDAAGKPVYPFAEAMQRERTINMVQGIHLEMMDGANMPVMVSATPVRDKGNALAGCVIVLRAVSESRRVSTKLSWHETHDPLTQLANRHQIENEIVRAIDNAHVEDGCHGFMYIDLFNFSMINDTSGHAAGDELLRQIARLLSRTVGDHDLVGRVGNDEFAVLLWHRSAEDIPGIAETILARVADFSLPWQDRRLKTGVSIGVEMITRDSTSETDVFLAARDACALAREAGRNRIHFPRKGRDLARRHNLSSIATSISEALEEERFVVYCQPMVSLQGQEEIRHYEALVRMIDREGKIVPPSNFIPAAEASGFIDDIDKWVFSRVVDVLQQLPASRQQQVAISVNLSGNTISDERFLEYVTDRLRGAALAPGALQFEITETAAVKHFDRAARFIDAMAEFGCKFALDDFGSGLSSFGYLKQLAVNYLKIDGSFVSRMAVEDVEYSMVSTINHLAHIMGLKTIAECVESEEQMVMLQEMGVDYGQGFFFEMPLPLDSILDRH